MKRLSALILTIVLLLSACTTEGFSSPTPTTDVDDTSSAAYASYPELPEIATVHLSLDGKEAWEYTAATCSAEWDGGSVGEQIVRVKYRGNSSKDVAKKSFNVKFEMPVDLFGMGAGKKWTLLASPFDKSLLRIVLGFDYAAAIGLPYTSETRLCKFYLDDRYMGIYTAVEPIEASSVRVDITESSTDFIVERDIVRWKENRTYIEVEGMRFEISVPEDPTAWQTAMTTDALEKVVAAVKTRDHSVYEQVIDVDSFVDFYIFEEIIKDIDFGNYSTRYFSKDGVLYAGPPWDLDLTQGNVSAEIYDETDYVKYATYHNKDGFGTGSGDSAHGFWARGKDFYQWLCNDKWFMERVSERWAELYPLTENLVRENELGASRMDAYLEAYGDDLTANYTLDGAGWSISETFYYADQEYGLTQKSNAERLRSWYERRIDWLNEKLG